jgi:hypothetical protein
MSCTDTNVDIRSLICSSDINNPKKTGDIEACVNNISSFANGTLSIPSAKNNSQCNKLLLGANYITSITTLIGQQQKELDAAMNNISTFEESIGQQINPETTITVRSQLSGIFSPPRPLKPVSISILLGITFILFFISSTIIFKNISNIMLSANFGSSIMSFDIVKNIIIGILTVVVLIIILKIANVF